MAYFKRKTDIANMQLMINLGVQGYRNYIEDLFNIDKEKSMCISEEYKRESLENYLDSIVGVVMLMKRDRKELIEKIDVRQNGKQLRSIESLNSALREQGINFYIDKFETSRMIDGKKKNYKSAWRVLKLVGYINPTPVIGCEAI